MEHKQGSHLFYQRRRNSISEGIIYSKGFHEAPQTPQKNPMEYKLIPAGCCRKRLEFLNALNNAQGQTFLPSLLLSTYRDGQKFHLGIFGMLPSDSTLGEGKQQRRKEPSPVLLQVLGLDPSLP